MQPSSPGATRKRPRDESEPQPAKEPRLAAAAAAGAGTAPLQHAGRRAPAAAAAVRGPGRPAAAKERRQALSLTKVEDPELLASLQRRILKLVFGSTRFKASKYTGGRPELPGPMACALTSHSLRESLCRFPYAVCEKSDGERFLFLITAATDGTPRAVLADRSFSLFELSGPISMGGGRAPSTVGAVMAQLVSPAGDTLVDGELVSRPALPPGKAVAGEAATPVFLVFDAVQVNGARTADKRLNERLAAVGTGLRERLRRDDVKRAQAGLPLLPLLVLGKTFFKAPDLHRVLAHVVSWPATRAPASPGDVTAAALKLGHGDGGAADGRAAAAAAADAAAGPTEHTGIGRAEVSVYSEGQRVNGNDGLVFTPEAPSYVDLLSMPDKAEPGGPPVQPLLKWKPLLENTVDFLVRMEDAEAAAGGGAGGNFTATLFSSAGGRTVDQAATSLSREQGLALVSVMRAHGKRSLVVECMVDEAAAKGVVRSLAGDRTAAELPTDRLTVAAMKLAFRRGLFYQRWVIIRLRPDKSRANSVLTANSTMEALADSVTPADISATLRQAANAPPPPSAPRTG